MKTRLSILFVFFVIVQAHLARSTDKLLPTNQTLNASGCSPSMASADLDINNVRASILIAGDMWSDLVSTAKYEIPRNSGKKSLYAGALWIGGVDASSNLYVAAQTYRQAGNDFWPGPLDTVTADVTSTVCSAYDHHWKITRQEVYDFIHGGVATPVIQSWPGNGNPTNNQATYLAPFVDVNLDGIYDWHDGDYPAYDFGLGSGNCNNYLQGEQTLWWVFNDKGNIHTESGSVNNFGIEIRAQAFAFSSPDTDLNNTTFYSYELINRSSQTYYNVEVGEFVDPDLGNPSDDYVGCDVRLSLGFAYNGDINDDGVLGYGLNPPAVGIDILQGPLADPLDLNDNDRDSIVDEIGEQIVMSTFLYYNNDFTAIGNPTIAAHYYNYLRGIWKDGLPLVYGGTGYQTTGHIGDTCNFMFPGDSDPYGWGTFGRPLSTLWPWTEINPLPPSASNTPDDRRFLMSCGKFTLHPGQVNNYSYAALWARSYSSGLMASVDVLKIADIKIQDFFDNCFTGLPTGISELAETSSSVFPNPASNQVSINFKNSGRNKTTLTITGVDCKSNFTFNEQNSEEFTINVENFANGIYYYLIQIGPSRKITGKFIVLH